MNTALSKLIDTFPLEPILPERKVILQPLIDYLKQKLNRGEAIRLNFICTHNSRRSHMAQVWAQTMAYHAGLKSIACYSGGTEETAMFPKVAETLTRQGFQVLQLAETSNPIYAVKYAANEAPIICFSKHYHHPFNPQQDYAAILTCDHADQGCPMVQGAEVRFPITYSDPKHFDGSELMDQKYQERSLQIAQEMHYLFQSILDI